MSTQHDWKFTRIGGFSQAKMQRASDFLNLKDLDQKLWAALACPVKGLAFDTRTLALLDGDNDGRIRAPELIEAVEWTKNTLVSLDRLAMGKQPVALSDINAESADGAGILASAKNILVQLDKADATEISVEDASNAAAALAKSKFNGDGVIPAASTDDEGLKTAIGEIVGALGAVADRSGDDGVNQANVDTFFADADAVIAWAAATNEDVLPLGDATAAAAGAIAAVKAKVDDFFARCRLAAFDARAIAALNRKEEEYLAIAAEDLTVTADEVRGFPLANVEAAKDLPLTTGLNPAWAGAIATLKSAAVDPIVGDKLVLSEADWNTVQAKVAAFNTHQAAKPASAVAAIDLDRLKELVASPAKTDLTDLITQDAGMADEVAAVDNVERLVRYQRDLEELSRNFVNFTDFYSDTERAVFEAGTLYLDGRACELVVRVDNAAKHAALAGRSKLFLAYCACTRPSGEKLNIAAAFTDGDSDYLMVGRNGVFYDRDGKDWDATITKIVDNPISLRQAFWSPYKQLVALFEDRAAKRAEAKAKEAETKRLSAANDVAGAPGEPVKPPSIDVGTAAAIAVGLGALGSMLVALIGYATGLFTLPFWIIVLVLLAIFIAISTPSVVMAYFKLRKRSLGPVLDSNGWAVNGQAGISVRFGRTMTEVAKLPKGARVDGKDKYADPYNPWPSIIMLLVVLGFVYSLMNWFGAVHTLTGGVIGTPADEVAPLVTVVVDEDAAVPDAAAPAE